MTRLRLHFINPLTVVQKTGIDYKLNLLRKFSTHSVFNAGLWMPYRDSSPVRLVAFALPWVAVPHFLHPRQDIELFCMKDVSSAPRHVVKSPWRRAGPHAHEDIKIKDKSLITRRKPAWDTSKVYISSSSAQWSNQPPVSCVKRFYKRRCRKCQK